jgi:hypothetical protein
VRDILRELEKPGRDPRPEFKTATFRDGVEQIKDLEPGMLLEGVVTNVTNFGAFVDIGVHQDGLVHVSAIANRFVKDPAREDIVKVKAGDIVRKVKVRKRRQPTMPSPQRSPRQRAWTLDGKRSDAQACIGFLLASYLPSDPKTFFARLPAAPTGFLRMAFSSSATIVNRPSRAFCVT